MTIDEYVSEYDRGPGENLATVCRDNFHMGKLYAMRDNPRNHPGIFTEFGIADDREWHYAISAAINAQLKKFERRKRGGAHL